MSEVPGHTMIVEPESQDDVVERLLGLSVVLGNLGLAAWPRSTSGRRPARSTASEV